MARRPLTACNYTGCPNLHRNKGGYCDEHGKHRHARKGSAHSRGYGAAWRKLRAIVMHRDGHLCQVCLANDRPEPATEVDHIIPKQLGGTDDLDNLRAICKACHIEKTVRENKARAMH